MAGMQSKGWQGIDGGKRRWRPEDVGPGQHNAKHFIQRNLIKSHRTFHGLHNHWTLWDVEF